MRFVLRFSAAFVVGMCAVGAVLVASPELAGASPPAPTCSLVVSGTAPTSVAASIPNGYALTCSGLEGDHEIDAGVSVGGFTTLATVQNAGAGGLGTGSASWTFPRGCGSGCDLGGGTTGYPLVVMTDATWSYEWSANDYVTSGWLYQSMARGGSFSGRSGGGGGVFDASAGVVAFGDSVGASVGPVAVGLSLLLLGVVLLFWGVAFVYSRVRRGVR